ncbi:type II toxin-antitoxin system antitoxin SocA domain-containing protein [Alistipes finegoldii]|jgi:hypothetical protein|uniref:type II toxin-antitoxin system antitoxin SocA domain-containing protein n=1 Tax=Alistipes finegoldii TaxID=214856 RepID=UPI000F62C6FD|nr:type II toxin-antitoxin system antitoxin SocA domain-containing protein [uncultured Alistipes sp.]
MNAQDKIPYFDYFISQIIFKRFNDNESNLDLIIRRNINRCGLNKLKLLKLLFFVSVLKVDEQYLLDDIFDNFYAMPYGPVESDVYNNISTLTNYIVGNGNISLKEHADFSYPDKANDPLYSRIDKCINVLYDKNPSLFNMPTFDLVELTHKADSWRIVFAEAQRRGKYSLHMPKEIIKETTVYFR